MSLQKEKRTCVVCHSYFFEDDDVVFCPTCGAPHHRECYNSLGKCALEELHGTDKEYDFKKITLEAEQEPKEEPKKQPTEAQCAFCYTKLKEDDKVCPYCGKPRIGMGFIGVDFLGGVDGATDIGDGVTATEARDFVVVNTHRYIPKFASKRKTSWNWMAFLLPQAWYFSRKMYALGAVILAVMVASSIITLPATNAILAQLPQEYTNEEFIRYLFESLSTMDIVPLLLMAVSSILNVAVRLFGGLFGDYWYKKHVISKIKDRANSDLEIEDYNQKYGGVNIILGLIGIIIISNLPSLLTLFIS